MVLPQVPGESAHDFIVPRRRSADAAKRTIASLLELRAEVA